MISLKNSICLTVTLSIGLLAGCAATKTPAVADATRKSLDQAGLKTVSVTQDRENGVLTLSGTVSTPAQKTQAESIARGLASSQVVADEIAVVPPHSGSEIKTMYADLDKGIQSNLDAALIQTRIPGTIRHATRNGVVILSGTVDSEDARTEAQQLASTVPNVQQVVNELQVKGQKATSTR
ncbi:MAG TPA: BON domain-containing protein [Bryobacteraceae bacterium]|nr:BON domain-containing protein [Bryobacteraceae bacterium]